MRVVTVEQLRTILRRAVVDHGIPEQVLLEGAGVAVAEVIREPLGDERFSVAVVCGPGAMGAVGFVVARKLRALGFGVEVTDLDQKRLGSGARFESRALAERSGVTIHTHVGPLEDGFITLVADARVVVDALIGAGLQGEPRGEIAAAIAAIEQHAGDVISLGLPSGIDGDTGLSPGGSVVASTTVAFGLPVIGNLLYPGFGQSGRLVTTDLSLPRELLQLQGDGPTTRLGGPIMWPPRQPDGHKGSFGDALFVAGAASYFGAPTFAAMSMLAAGGGYSRLAAPRSIVPSLAPLAPEVVFAPQRETVEGTLDVSAIPAILELARAVDVVVVGPGLSLQVETQRVVHGLVEAIDAPLIIDGDGLTAITSDLGILRRRSAPTVLTPHLGEMARLTGASIGELRCDPVGRARALASELDVTVVLKGAHSLVATSDGEVVINPSGNSGMGTAGSGDILTGTIAAACGLGCDLDLAARAGVFCHGLAGDLAAAEIGEDGVTARDVLAALPRAVRALREDLDALARDQYGVIESR